MEQEKSRLEQEFQKREKGQLVRLNKFISESGLCSRREADRLIEAGRVLVDGSVAVSGQKVSEKQEVLVDGKHISKEEEMVLLGVLILYASNMGFQVFIFYDDLIFISNLFQLDDQMCGMHHIDDKNAVKHADHKRKRQILR